MTSLFLRSAVNGFLPSRVISDLFILCKVAVSPLGILGGKPDFHPHGPTLLDEGPELSSSGTHTEVFEVISVEEPGCRGCGQELCPGLTWAAPGHGCPGQGTPAPLWTRPSCSDCPWQSCICREQSRDCHLLENTFRSAGRCCPCPSVLLDHCPFLPTCALLLWSTGCPAFLSPLLLARAFWGPTAPSCTHRRVYQRIPVFLPVTTYAASNQPRMSFQN